MIFDGFGRNSLDCEGKKHVFVCFVFNLETCYMLANAMLICSLAFRVYFVRFIVGLNMLFFPFKLLLPLTSNIISLSLFSTDFWSMHSFSFPWFPSSLFEVCQCLFFSHRMKFMAQITEVPCVL